MRLIRGRARGMETELRSSTFTGTVWADPVLPTEDDVTINSVFFAPGARTFWHYHERGQILQITAGRGLVCPERGEPIVVQVGDTIWTSPGERHWHGGGIHCCLEHIAISLGRTTWLDPVDADDYERASVLLSEIDQNG